KISVIKVYFLKIKKISAHNLSGGADTQNFSHTLPVSVVICVYGFSTLKFIFILLSAIFPTCLL
ncbi:MAG: hypothetical protein E6Y30_08885, partial [Finegoldia magna]|nr:hypothetical protein [Finegoldia magna]